MPYPGQTRRAEDAPSRFVIYGAFGERLGRSALSMSLFERQMEGASSAGHARTTKMLYAGPTIVSSYGADTALTDITRGFTGFTC
jgi:hypothetical protein